MNLRRATSPTVALTMLVVALGVIGLSPADASPTRATRPARGLPIDRCTGDRGTIVAVDFAHWGGPIVRGCGMDEPTGYALLHATGFTTVGDAHDGPGFVCRLADAAFRHGTPYPTPSRQPCANTPSASAYWSVWRAGAGSDRWHYSQLGAMSDHPAAGEVELWSFGGTDLAGTRGSGVPSLTPDQLRSTERAPAVPVKGPALVDALPTAEHTSAGSAAPLIVGGCATLALLAGAAVTARRRRRDR